jgi:hypothetical protein
MAPQALGVERRLSWRTNEIVSDRRERQRAPLTPGHVGRLHEQTRDAQHRVVVLIDEVLERRLVALQQPRDELGLTRPRRSVGHPVDHVPVRHRSLG